MKEKELGKIGNGASYFVASRFLELVLKKWVRIATISLGSSVLGLLLTFLWPAEYLSEIYLLPEQNESASLGGLSGLAGVAGINLDAFQNTSGIPPTAYSKIVGSDQVNYEILNSYLYNTQGDSILVREYIKDELKTNPVSFLIYLPTAIKKKLTSSSNLHQGKNFKNDYLIITESEDAMIRELKDRINVSYDQINRIIYLGVKMQDRVYSAQILDMVISKLESKLTDYKTEKERSNVEFISEQLVGAKQKYEASRDVLAQFIERNKNVNTQSLQLQEDFLKSEYNLVFNIYSTLSQQYSQSLLKLEESKPEFAYLDSVRVPIERSSPKRKIIAVLFFLIGCMVAVTQLIISNSKELTVTIEE